MARSRRKHPFSGVTTAASDKTHKVLEHRRERRAVAVKLVRATDDIGLPEPKQYGNPWTGCKDGKSRDDPKDPASYRK